MPIIEKYFPSQKPEEKIFLLLRRHWFSYVSFLMIGLIMSIPLFVLFGYYLAYSQDFSSVLSNILTLVASAYLLFIVGLLLYGFIDYYLDVYIVTNEELLTSNKMVFLREKFLNFICIRFKTLMLKLKVFLRPCFIMEISIFKRPGREKILFLKPFQIRIE